MLSEASSGLENRCGMLVTNFGFRPTADRGRGLGVFLGADAQSLASQAGSGGLPKRLSVDILQRFPATQRAQSGAIQPHISLYFTAVSPGVLTQRPAYRLLQEEFPRSERRFDAGIQ